MLTMAFFRILLLSCICCGFSLTAELKDVRELTDKDFNNFTDSPNVRVVYFYDNKLSEEGKVKLKFLPLSHSQFQPLLELIHL